MGTLADCLYFAGREIEAYLQAHHVEVLNEGLESALPQTWKFETERESVFLHLDTKRHISVSVDSTESPSVIVRWAQAPLMDALLQGNSRCRAPAPIPSVYFASESGRKAFHALGVTLGL